MSNRSCHRDPKHPTNRFGGHAPMDRRGSPGPTDFEVELIDLKVTPCRCSRGGFAGYAPSKNEVAQRWQKKVGEFDALSSRLPNTIADRPGF